LRDTQLEGRGFVYSLPDVLVASGRNGPQAQGRSGLEKPAIVGAERRKAGPVGIRLSRCIASSVRSSAGGIVAAAAASAAVKTRVSMVEAMFWALIKASGRVRAIARINSM
jgi:hypothetical protein